jgi:hypothetical protein
MQTDQTLSYPQGVNYPQFTDSGGVFLSGLLSLRIPQVIPVFPDSLHVGKWV